MIMFTELSKVQNLSLVMIIIIEKDFNEMAALKTVMPHARIQLCKFHVMQAMNREIRKLQVADWDKTTYLIRKIVF